MKKANIIGAGLVGSLWSLYLQQRGYHVDIYERRPDPRKAGYIGGRSINLSLSDRGWKALKGAGIQQEVEAMAIPMRRRVIHAKKRQLILPALRAIWPGHLLCIPGWIEPATDQQSRSFRSSEGAF
ncbi:NAD(P)-binding protein [Schleiferiaceae bacterium]|nr:NAD(P)-binding protein [Schleiferiaceae bacterium]